MRNFPSDVNTQFKIHLVSDVYNQLRTRLALGIFKGEINYLNSDIPLGSTPELVLVTYDDLVDLGMPEYIYPAMGYDLSTGIFHYDLT